MMMDIRRREMVMPSLLKAADSFLGVLILATWLPLLHLVIANEVKLGRRFQVMDDLLPAGMEKTTLLVWLAAIMVAATAAKIFSSYWAERLVSVQTSRAETAIGEHIIRRHLRFGQSYYDAIKPGHTIKNIMRLPSRAARLIRWLVRLFSTTLVLCLYVLLMVWLSPALAGFSVCLLLVYHLFVRKLIERTESKLGDDDDLDDAADSDVRDLAENLLLLRLHAAEGETVRAFREKSTQRAIVKEQRDGLAGLVEELREGGNILIMLLFILAAGWALQGMSGGDVARYLVFFIVFRRAMRPFAVLQRLPRQWTTLSGNLDEVAELLGDEGKSVVSSGHRSVDSVPDCISVRNLTFSYHDKKLILDSVNFLARKGELTVLVGPNGSGKSTVLKLFMRLYDVQPGSLYFDAIDLREFEMEDLRRKCGYTGAEPLMLNASLRENLTIGLHAVTDEALWRVAHDVGMDGFVSALEGGFDHEIGSRGMRLSQGQRQKIALARVLLRNPYVIFLDEASSSFDPAAEREMMIRLQQLAVDRVIVAVTHRVSSIPPGAHVVVMKNGQVTEDGCGCELQAKGGMYKKMLDSRDVTSELSAGI